MRKYPVIAAIMFLIAASTAIQATSASAEGVLAEWLINGSSISSSLGSNTSGTLLLRDAKLGVAVSCNAILDGTIGPDGEDSTTELLTLAGVVASLTSPLLCTATEGCETSATDVEAAAENLPWSSLVQTIEGRMIDLVKESTFFISCLVLGIKTSEECTSTSSEYEAVNVTGGVELIGGSVPLAKCTVGGNESGEVCLIENTVTPNEGGTLAVSE